MNRDYCGRGLIVAVLAGSVALAACTSNSIDGEAKEPSTGVASPSTRSANTSEQALTDALLTPAEVGPEFTAIEFQPANNPLLCLPDNPSVEDRFPSRERVGTAMRANNLGASLSEEIRIMADATAAQQALAYVVRGLQCSSGRLNLTGTPETVQLGPIQLLPDAMHADGGISVPATTSQFQLLLVAAQVDRQLITLAFVKAKTTPDSALPSPLAVVERALDKIG